jgi:hypothetical protein
MTSEDNDGMSCIFSSQAIKTRKIKIKPEFNVVNYILAADGNIITG